MKDYKLKVWGFAEELIQQAETKEENWVFRWRDFTLPFAWVREDIFEIDKRTVKINLHQALDIAKETAEKDILAKMNTSGFIKEQKVLHHAVENDKVYIKIHVAAIEDIAKYEPIIFEGD
jgi:similar to stage IV sporulation protein